MRTDELIQLAKERGWSESDIRMVAQHSFPEFGVEQQFAGGQNIQPQYQQFAGVAAPSYPFYREPESSQLLWALIKEQNPAVSQICPPIAVPFSSGLYWVYDPAYTYRNTESRLEFTTEPLLSPWRVTQHRFECFLNYVARSEYWKDAANTSPVLDVGSDAIQHISNVLTIGWETQLKDVTLLKSNWQKRSVANWSERTGKSEEHMFVDFAYDAADGTPDYTKAVTDAANAGTTPNNFNGRIDIMTNNAEATACHFWDSLHLTQQTNPISYMQRAMAYVYNKSGFTPNVALMSKSTFHRLASNPALRDIYKYTQAGVASAFDAGAISMADMAKWMGVERIVFSDVVENIADQPEDTKMAPVFGRTPPSAHVGQAAADVSGSRSADVALLYLPPRNGMKVPSVVKCFAWTRYFQDASVEYPMMQDTVGVRRIVRPERDMTEVRGYRPTSVKLTSNMIGFVFFNVMAPM